MSDSLRIRLEFRNFGPEIRNSLLSFSAKEIHNIRQLEELIRERHAIDEPICLLIDSFAIHRSELIDVVRDNEIVVVEREAKSLDIKPDIKNIKIKSEPIDSENNSSESTNSLLKSDETTVSSSKSKGSTKKNRDNTNKSARNDRNKSKSKSNLKRKLSDSSNGHKLVIKKEANDEPNSAHESTEFDVKKQKLKENDCADTTSEMKEDLKHDCMDEWSHNSIAKRLDSNELSNDSSLSELYSSRNTPMRKAFQAATKSIKALETPKPPTTSKTNGAPKRKPLSREAREPVDKFSPIILLEDLKTSNYFRHNILSNADKTNDVTIIRKQSARKSFPTPPSPSNRMEKKINNIIDELESKLEDESKIIDYNNCEPLGEIPKVGDLIAFKILTLSANSDTPEVSPFNTGSVINVNHRNNMIDVLIENNLINENSLDSTTESEQNRKKALILKLEWSTILEPKMIQRQHLLLSESN